MDVVARLLQHNAGRDPERLALKWRRMRVGPFNFLRGSCALFNERLKPTGWLRKAPAVWACGDLHAENFGSVRGEGGQVCFEIDDFDEGLLAPAPWDLLHLLASLRLGLPDPAYADVLLPAYVEALLQGKARWLDAVSAPLPVRGLLEAAQQRSRADFLDTRTERRGRRRRIRLDNGKALPASAAQADAVRGFFERFAASQPEPRAFEVIDVARRIAGTGSLGLERYIVLVRGKGSPDGNRLLDLKQARPPCTPPLLPQPRWAADDAQRIVAVQQRLQAVHVGRLHAVQLQGRPFVLRALQPSEDRIAIGPRRPAAERQGLVATLGRCLAWAQLRSSGRDGAATADALMDFAAKAKWRARLQQQAAVAAEQVRADWQVFSVAYDAGVFTSG